MSFTNPHQSESVVWGGEPAINSEPEYTYRILGTSNPFTPDFPRRCRTCNKSYMVCDCERFDGR